MTTLAETLKAKMDDDGHNQGLVTIHEVTLSRNEPDSWQQSGACLARIKKDG